MATKKTVFSSLSVYSYNSRAKLGNSNKMRNRKRSSMKEVWETRAVFVPISSEIRPNVPAVALCCCGDNYNVGEQKESEKMLHNTLRKSNSSPKTRHLNQLFIWKALGLNERKTCWKAVCGSAGSLFPRRSPNLISLLHDTHSSMKITTQDTKNTLWSSTRSKLLPLIVQVSLQQTLDQSKCWCLSLLVYDWNIYIHLLNKLSPLLR